MSEAEEGAKAVQELAKLGTATIENLDRVEKIGRHLLGPFGQAYGILTDLVAYKREEIRWRLANKLAIYQKAINKAELDGLSIEDLRPVPPRIAYDYEESLEREDDPTVQELWAKLLINVTNPHTSAEPRKVFKDILERLDSDLAKLFNAIGRQSSIRCYFIVAGMDTGGTEIGVVPYGDGKILSGCDIFEADNDRNSIYCEIGERRLEVLLDELASIGIINWDKELLLSEELMESEEAQWPSSNYSELGRRILNYASGVRVFAVSALGQQFWHAINGTPMR